MKKMPSFGILFAGLACLFAPLQLMAGFPAYICGQWQGPVYSVCYSSTATGCPGGYNVVLCTGGDCAGTEGDDCIIGTNGADVISAGGGDDRVCAFAGNDVVRAGYGWDVVCGGWGEDLLEGGWGNDNLGGEQDRDILQGGNCNDQLVGGGQYSDACKGGNGADSIYNCDITDLGRQTPETGGKCDL